MDCQFLVISDESWRRRVGLLPFVIESSEAIQLACMQRHGLLHFVAMRVILLHEIDLLFVYGTLCALRSSMAQLLSAARISGPARSGALYLIKHIPDW